MFEDKSRYKGIKQLDVKDPKRKTVKVVIVPDAPRNGIMGYHALKQGQRLDHLAAKYLNDPVGFWRIAESNDAMLPEALSEQSEIAIPNKY